MSNRVRESRCFWGIIAIACLWSVSVAGAADWPQWRGPERDGVWRESKALDTLPAGDLQVRWRVPAAHGYAGPAVADGKVYLFEYEILDGEIRNDPGARVKLQGKERLRCLDAATGDQLWQDEVDRAYKISYPGGPRCTPTVDGDHVYTLGAEGDLRCLSTSDGSFVWSKSFREDYGAKTPIWGHAAHPLVDDETVYCIVGGEGSIAVAFDKLTGEEKWKSMSAYQPGYCPPTFIEYGGKRQLLIFHPEAINAVDSDTGEVTWSVPIKPSYGMSIAQPFLVGDKLFVSGFGESICLDLSAAGDTPEVLWAGSPKTSVSSANVFPITDGQAIYGVNANNSLFVAVDPATGKRFWESKVPTLGAKGRGRHGTAFIVRQGETDRYWLLGEKGELILARLSPEKYEELGRKKILEPTGETSGRPVLWSHPAFAQGAIFARNDKEIVCVELTK